MPVRFDRESIAFMDRLSRLLTPEYSDFLLGAVFLLWAILSAFFGACPGRGAIVYRAKNPKEFWISVSILSVLGAFFWLRFATQ